MSDPVPPRFRPVIEEVVRRMAEGAWDGLVRDGTAPRVKTGEELRYRVGQQGSRLVPLPSEAWNASEHGRIEVEPETWWVVVPLWTDDEGRSDVRLRQQSESAPIECPLRSTTSMCSKRALNSSCLASAGEEDA